MCLVAKNWDSGVKFWISLKCRFTNVLVGLASDDMIQRTARRLDTLHSEGVHVCIIYLVCLRVSFESKKHAASVLGVKDLLTSHRLFLYTQRLSELCCFAASQLVMLGKSIISTANKAVDQDADAEIVKMDWPEDSIERAKIIRAKACSMTGCVEAVSSSFITGRFVSNILLHAFVTFILFLFFPL